MTTTTVQLRSIPDTEAAVGIRLASLQAEVAVTFEGTPLIATQAVMHVNVTASEKDADIAALIKRARDISAVANTLKRGLSVETIVNKDG